MKKIGATIRIGDAALEAELEDSEAVKAVLGETYPRRMSPLNGNELYCYFERCFPSFQKPVGHVEKGDVMLFGSNCLVVFHESFSTPYSYTRLGRIKDADALDEAIRNGDYTLSIERN